MRILCALVLIGPVLSPAQAPVPVNNEWARVVVAKTGPGPKGRLHKHDTNRVMIYLDKGAQRLEFDGGPKKDIAFDAGDVKWDTSGGLHTSENTGGTTFRIVEVELKKSGGPVTFSALDPVKVAPGVYKVEIDNPQVRVLRARLGPGQAVALHEHALPRVVVPLSDVELKVTGADGKESVLKAKAGDVIFGPGVRHREVNLRDAVAELILVEFKG